MNENTLADAAERIESYSEVIDCKINPPLGFVVVFEEMVQSYEEGLSVIEPILSEYEPYKLDNFAGVGADHVQIAVFPDDE